MKSQILRPAGAKRGRPTEVQRPKIRRFSFRLYEPTLFYHKIKLEMTSDKVGRCDFGPWEVLSTEGPILTSQDEERYLIFIRHL